MKRALAALTAAGALLLAVAPAHAAQAGQGNGDTVLYVAAAPFALGAIAVVVHLCRSIWLLTRPRKRPVL